MFWGKGPDKSPETKPDEKNPATPSPVANAGSAGSFSKDLPPHEKLPKSLQTIVDKDDTQDNFYDEVFSGYAPESTESNVRYAAYAARLRTILLSAHRYVAYTSDIGESFRPVAHPFLVRSAYGISWAYILGDVGYEGYKAYWQNQRKLHPDLLLTERQRRIANIQHDPAPPGTETKSGVITPLEDYRTVMAQRAIFQSVASMGLPAFTIHSVVRYSGRAMKDVKNKLIRTWAPIGLGLAVVPFLPVLFDKPVENTVEYIFHKGFEMWGGKEAVGDAPRTGREKILIQKQHEKKE